MVKLLAERTPAKINLFLRVTGRRSDGYHELDSIFIPISIYDRIGLEIRPAASATVTLRCNWPSLQDAKSNLVARAALAFMSEFAVAAQVAIDLEKTIPMGAGLGGGSSDAGAVLWMMAALYRVDARERLGKLALGLGADVPFFLDPRASRVGGVGERITALGNFPRLHLVVAVPPVEVPTAAIFKALTREDWSGAATDEDVARIVSGKIEARDLANDLAGPAMRLYPQIAKLKVSLEQCGARAAAMTGSGGAVFGLFHDRADAARAAQKIAADAPDARVFATTSVSPS
jgi:4-diphosphocytidyl-2-C-methyl-D-erythritol kinase